MEQQARFTIIIVINILVIMMMFRERLEKLSALRKIKPVDMTTLSQQVTIILVAALFIIIVLNLRIYSKKTTMGTSHLL